MSQEEDRFVEEVEEFQQRLVKGTPIVLEGLASRPDLNGRAGVLGNWVKDKSRWEVQCGHVELLVKPANLFPPVHEDF